MDAKMQTFLEKVKVMADKTGKAAGRAADAAGKKATELASATRIKLHRGTEVSNEEMDQKIDLVDEKQARIAALREELAGMKSVVTCPHCGRPCSREDAFCSGCGGAL